MSSNTITFTTVRIEGRSFCQMCWAFTSIYT
jgi:hypothetical protein